MPNHADALPRLAPPGQALIEFDAEATEPWPPVAQAFQSPREVKHVDHVVAPDQAGKKFGLDFR